VIGFSAGNVRALGLGCAALALVLTGCGSDDGGTVRESGESGSGSTSGSGLSGSELSGAGADNPKIQQAVTDYRAYVVEQVDLAVTDTKKMTDAIREGDLKAARQAYAQSRVAWETIEPIASLVEEIDGKVDARVDDFAGANDPAFTGWHRLEYMMFKEKSLKGAQKYADMLDADLQTLKEQVPNLEIPPAAVAIGSSELIEEVSLGKITGEEDRYAKTDLWDFGGNVVGSQKAFELLKPALEEKDPELVTKLDEQYAALWATLKPLQKGANNWVLYCLKDDEYPSKRCKGEVTVPPATVNTLKAQLAALSESTSQIAGALGVA